MEFIIDNNATREKTAEQKSREAKALKEVESVLANKRRIATQNNNSAKADTPNSACLVEDKEKGEARNIVAQKVGLKSGHEVDRAIRAVNVIDELTEKGRIDDAALIRGVLNNRSISAAEELAKNIDMLLRKSLLMMWLLYFFWTFRVIFGYFSLENDYFAKF